MYTRSEKTPQQDEKQSNVVEVDLLRLSEAGDSESQFLLSQYYEEHGNIRKAVHWCKNAAKSGYFKAVAYLCVLGERYEYGKGTAVDDEAAYGCYKIAADMGYAEAQYKLGLFFLMGKAVYADEEEARRYWKLAAKSGHAKAQLALE